MAVAAEVQGGSATDTKHRRSPRLCSHCSTPFRPLLAPSHILGIGHGAGRPIPTPGSVHSPTGVPVPVAAPAQGLMLLPASADLDQPAGDPSSRASAVLLNPALKLRPLMPLRPRLIWSRRRTTSPAG